MLALEIGKIYKKRQTYILQNLRKSVAMYIYEYVNLFHCGIYLICKPFSKDEC